MTAFKASHRCCNTVELLRMTSLRISIVSLSRLSASSHKAPILPECNVLWPPLPQPLVEAISDVTRPLAAFPSRPTAIASLSCLVSLRTATQPAARFSSRACRKLECRTTMEWTL